MLTYILVIYIKKFEFAAISRNLEKKWPTLGKILTLKKKKKQQKYE